ncbi:uncharacterized protein HMPREF1541_05183 [Cyphellophora europaea CBS 101466]|uniref:Uncharacterized protein n=1 Tax=Cyphellophora europaea (strain CBS 101466) TaxID=1220924 RepID=W2RYS0_CYPE1|nr:uncharacterized protein HMPREF1541_05183 [Cyphellophora europaea CBS 101466]ETN40903.1 hypothetical protein HMPREF1541_05183 [Cyphellophora europaea CBS 101466]
MSPTKNAHKALAELSPNTTSPSKTSSHDQVKSKIYEPLDESNNVLKMPATASFPIHNNHTTNYISPSDAMQSPTSKKLSDLKGRRFAGAKTKQGLSGRELFAKARAQNEKNNSSGAVRPAEPISPMSLSQTDSQADSQTSAASSRSFDDDCSS